MRRPDVLEVGRVVVVLDAPARPTLASARLDASLIELPAVGIGATLGAATQAIAGQEEPPALAQGQAPGLVDGPLLLVSRVGAIGPIELIARVISHVIALAVLLVARTMIALHGVVPGVLLRGYGSGFERGSAQACGPFTRSHHARHVPAEVDLVHAALVAAQHLDGRRRDALAGPASARGCRDWCRADSVWYRQDGDHGRRAEGHTQHRGGHARSTRGRFGLACRIRRQRQYRSLLRPSVHLGEECGIRRSRQRRGNLAARRCELGPTRGHTSTSIQACRIARDKK